MATPTLVFLVGVQLWSLRVALLCAISASLALVGLRAAQRRSLAHPLIGVAIVVACAIGAALTDETRGFFIVPAVVPLVVTIVCVVTIATRRPLTGLLLNRAAGGPADWRSRRQVLRIYLRTTWACVVLDGINFAIQVLFYERNDTTILAVAHVATGPLFALVVAWTIAMVRKARATSLQGVTS